MEIILVRHGQSETNVSKTLSNPQTVLTKDGIKQAEKLAARLSTFNIDLILTSDYVRAMQTAEIINKSCRSEMLREPLIREKTVPTKMLGQSAKSTDHQDYVKQLLEHLAEPDWHYADEENVFDVHKRAKEFANKLTALNKNNVLVVSHTGFLKVFLATIMLGDHWNPVVSRKVYDFLKHGNTAVSRLHLDDKRRFKLINWNDEAHLGE